MNSTLFTVLLSIQIVSALVMIGLILIQQGKGADAGAAFGGGASASLFGATGGANFLSRMTAVLATVFLLSTLVLAYMGGRTSVGSGSSVLDNAQIPAAPVSEIPSPAALVPAAPAKAPVKVPATTPAAPASSSSQGVEAIPAQ